MRFIRYRLARLTPAGVTSPVYELTVNDATRVELPAEVWVRIAQSVRDDVDAAAAGVCIATPGTDALVKV